MYKAVEVGHDKERLDGFLALPKRLYDKGSYTQDMPTEELLLQGRHPLSKYFTLHAFVVYDGAEVAGRFALTAYPQEKTLYLGFYECIDSDACAEAIFKAAHSFAREQGSAKVTGPVDASFWIKYRLKADHFDPPYMSEPYNKEYYLKQWLDNGFEVAEEYISNIYGKAPLVLKEKDQYQAKYQEFKDKGYAIRSLTKKTFDTGLGEIYGMLMELYSGFPVFEPLAEEDFRAVFDGFRYIVDYRMVKLAYYQGRPAGFLINLPDYGNLLHGKLTLPAKLRVLLRRIRARRYVSLYLGVRPEHHGLARAMLQPTIKGVYLRRASIIGALTKRERVTAHYLTDMIAQVDQYVLLTKEIPWT